MRKPYPSDLTDEEWAIVEPLIPVNKMGRPRTNKIREIINTLLYLKRSGCPWDMIPHDLPPKSTVYNYFAQWRHDGTWQQVMGALGSRAGSPRPRGPSRRRRASANRRSRRLHPAARRGYNGPRRLSP